jgi:hypothetical protein
MLETEMGNKQYEIIRDEEQCIIRLNVYGQLEKDVGEKIITEARTQAAENQFNILCDVRQAKVNVAFIDWFYLPRKLDVYSKTKTVKTAILVTPGQQEEEYSFFETVTHNLGINVKIFIQEKDALEWSK